MNNDPAIPNDKNSTLDGDGGSPYNETRAQCLNRCMTEYNTCMATPNPGETPAQQAARCQAAYTTCCSLCPAKCE